MKDNEYALFIGLLALMVIILLVGMVRTDVQNEKKLARCEAAEVNHGN